MEYLIYIYVLVGAGALVGYRYFCPKFPLAYAVCISACWPILIGVALVGLTDPGGWND